MYDSLLLDGLCMIHYYLMDYVRFIITVTDAPFDRTYDEEKSSEVSP